MPPPKIKGDVKMTKKALILNLLTCIIDGYTIEELNEELEFRLKQEEETETAESGRNDLLVSVENGWTQVKPNYPCVFMTRVRNERLKIWDYNIWRIEKLKGEEDGTYYLGWLTEDGEEWDDINSIHFDEYFIIEKS